MPANDQVPGRLTKDHPGGQQSGSNNYTQE
jgi:hypothetical protein